MYTHTFEAFGTKWWIELYDEQTPETLEAAASTIELFAHDFEAKYSRFKADSQLSLLNRERTLENPSAEFCAVLAYGKQIYLRSNTHFNLLTGHLQETHGYDSISSFAPSEPEKLSLGNPITDLLITPEKIELLYGTVDIGGFGKGYLIDTLTALLQNQFSLQHFLINGGGNMYGTSKQGEPIQIFLEHPTKPSHFIHVTTLKDQGFAAASPFKRVWHSSEKTFTHIISNGEAPRVASFVKSATARDANAFATTALLLEEPELTAFATTESIAIARFSPATNKLWRTASFDT